MIRLFCILLGYFFGLFQTSIIYGKLKGVDVRQKGSGNAGTTNTLRVLGVKAGVIVLVGDILKCMIPIFLVRFFCKGNYGDILPLLAFYTGAGAILGHNYPFYLKFKGGKGIATTAGLILTLPWQFPVIEAIVFFTLFFTTHYVSLGSLCVYVVLIIEVVVAGQLGMFQVAQPVLNEMYIVVGLLAVLAFWKHRGNMVRLVKGEERKTYLSHKKNKEAAAK